MLLILIGFGTVVFKILLRMVIVGFCLALRFHPSGFRFILGLAAQAKSLHSSARVWSYARILG